MCAFHVSGGGEKHVKAFGRLPITAKNTLAEALPVAGFKGGNDLV